MPKILITGRMVISQQGTFESGQTLTCPPYAQNFLEHLVNEAGAAEWVDAPSYEAKVRTDYEPVKKSALSTQSLPPAKAPRKKTRSMRTRKAPAS